VSHSSLYIPVIGAGSIGTRHHGNLNALGVKTELFSYRKVQGQPLATLFEGDEISGCVIATATDIRTELITLCVEHDVPFYVEKPLAFTEAACSELEALATSVASRSMVGFMMRYHPLFRRLAQSDLSDIYRFELAIGHDVNQWRDNWSFSQSYAAKENGGGVLLDLCHEIDMLNCLLPQCELQRVDCIGHQQFNGVDFASSLFYSGPPQGVVSMDYLSPVSTRKATFYGTQSYYEVDFAAMQFTTGSKGGSKSIETIEFDRNDMFLDAMKDFLGLISKTEVSSIEHLPRFDHAIESSKKIANAWERREFSGKLQGDVT